jgi:hypothetical protein
VALRRDHTRADKAVKTSSGGLRVPAIVTAPGVYDYTRADGTVVREYRPPEEVARADSLASLRDAPVTDDHPRHAVTPENWRQLSIGHVSGDPTPTAEGIATSIVVHDGQAIKRVGEDLVEVSCGYQVELDTTPGVTPDGKRYDAVQRNIVYNHVALGPTGWGRQGATVALRLDSNGDQNEPPESLIYSGPMKLTFKIDGKTVEVEAGSAEHLRIQEKLDAGAAALAAATKRADTEAARADAAETALAVAKTSLAKFEALEAAKAREALEANARKVLGAEAKFDGKSDRDVRVAAILHADKAFVADGKSDDYVSARFDSELAHATAKPTANPTLTLVSQLSTARADAEFDVDAEIAKHRAAAKDLWRTPAKAK